MTQGMRRLLFAFLALIGFAPSPYAADFTGAKCAVPELIGQPPFEYDRLVCLGIAMMERGDYSNAIAYFEKAMSIQFVHTPNFQLYPRLALAHYKAGNTAKAAELLKKAELSLKVFTRILRCDETDSGFQIVQMVWGEDHKIDSLYLDEIMDRMCGAAYDSAYRRESLADLAFEGALVKNYLDIKATIESGK